VAQSWAATWHPGIGNLVVCKMFWRPWDLTPGPPLINHMVFKIFEFELMLSGEGSGRGLASAHSCIVYHVTLYGGTLIHISNEALVACIDIYPQLYHMRESRVSTGV
jgi:hypothetical protein